MSAPPSFTALETVTLNPADDAAAIRQQAFKTFDEIFLGSLTPQQQQLHAKRAFNLALIAYKRDLLGAQQAAQGLATTPATGASGSTPQGLTKVTPENPSFWKRTNFDTIIGMDREKNEMRKAVVYPLQYPLAISKVRAILLYGPPGTGKTLIAAATPSDISNYRIKPYFFLGKGSTMLGKYVGETERNIESLFVSAEEKVRDACGFNDPIKPTATSVRAEVKDDGDSTYEAKLRSCSEVSLLFIDELEAFGLKRSQQKEGGAGPGALNTLLAMMDGARKYEFVIVLGSTNRPFDLDSALLSRFPVKLFVDTLGDIARFKFFQNSIRKRASQILKALNFAITDDKNLDNILQQVAPHIYTDFLAPKPDALFGPTIDINSQSIVLLTAITGWTDGVLRDTNLNPLIDAIKNESKTYGFDQTTTDILDETKKDRLAVFSDESKARKILQTIRDVKGQSYLPAEYLNHETANPKSKETEGRADFSLAKSSFNLSSVRFGYSNRDLDAIFNRFVSKMFETFLEAIGTDDITTKRTHLELVISKTNPQIILPYYSDAEQAPLNQKLNTVPLFDVLHKQSEYGPQVRLKRNNLLVEAVRETSSSVVPDEYVELRFYQRFGNRINT